MPELRAPETVCPARSRAVSWARRLVTNLSDKVVKPGSEMRSVTVWLDRWRARVQFRFKAARIPLWLWRAGITAEEVYRRQDVGRVRMQYPVLVPLGGRVPI